jgi:acetolactate synthase-1/2/3 large subunit
MEAEPVTLANGSQLYVEVSGQGQELILFLHAVGGDHTSWEPQVEALKGHYVCASYDMRGHNRSPVPADIQSQVHVAGFAEDAILLIEHLGFRRAHLVGLSMGGVVALEVFRQRSQVVQSLVIANSWAFYPEAEARNAFITDTLAKMSMPESAAAAMPFLYAPGTPQAILDKAAKTEGSKNKEVFLQSWFSMFEVDYREMLPRIDVPVLAIGGPHDPVSQTGVHARLIYDHIPTAELVEIPGAGHFSNLDHPAEFNRALAGFLTRARGQGSQHLVPPARTTRHLEAATVAQALVGLLERRGLEYFFSNSGTDFTPIIDAFARYQGQAPDTFGLKPVLAPHENTAIAMAHGYFLLSGKPQAVMAHVNVGTANMGLGLINAARARIPMLVLAGKTPWYESEIDGSRTNFVQWGQDTFDQGAYFREFTRWDYELKGAHNLETVVDRALAISQSDPAGPVYLTLPKEPLCEKVDGFSYSSVPRQQPNAPAEAGQDAIEEAARLIAAAHRPLIITAELGRYRGGPENLVQLSARHALGVIEHGKHNFFNFPTDHPHHLGFNPSPQVEAADLLIVIESHVPWIPAFSKVANPPTIIQIGVDPLYHDLPMRSFPSDLSLAGHPALTLHRLAAALDHLGAEDENYRARISERSALLESTHRRLWRESTERAAADGAHPAITKQYLSYCVGQAVDDNVVIFNEYDLEPQLVPRRLPGSWFENSIASGLGWSLGAALGGQLARPDQTMLVTLGDGAYLFNTPISAHYVASAYKLPIMIVVFNDKGWTTIKKSYLGTTPDGWAQKTGNFPLTAFDPQVDLQYDKLAEACGGIGLRVETPEELPQALARGLQLVRQERRHVLLNVICEPDA